MRLRIRHPNGQSVLTIDDDDTVQSLLSQIHTISGIFPSEQILKTGYPPKPLEAIAELPLSSLGLSNNEQLVISKSTVSAPPSQAVQQPIAPKSPPRSQAGGPDHVSTPTGYLVHRIVPDDNSCLFTSLSLVLKSDDQSQPSPSDLRALVARSILADPVKYNDAILGMDPQKYAQTITKPNTWGGAIELTVLAQQFNVEICSIDVETGRIDQFEPEGGAEGGKCIVLYSGIHYDAATLAPELGVPDEWHQTLFSISDVNILVSAKELAAKLRAKKAYTNTNTFDLKCEQCGKGLKGEKEARAHAEETGHVRFGEY